jgi:hypothetical protein
MQPYNCDHDIQQPTTKLLILKKWGGGDRNVT